jgi:hypothetical protein
MKKCKNQSLVNAARIRQRPVAVAGFRRESLTESGWIRSYPAGIFRIRPDQWQDPPGLARIRQYSGRNLVAGIQRRWPDTSDRMLSDSGAGWISTIDNC